MIIESVVVIVMALMMVIASEMVIDYDGNFGIKDGLHIIFIYVV